MSVPNGQQILMKVNILMKMFHCMYGDLHLFRLGAVRVQSSAAFKQDSDHILPRLIHSHQLIAFGSAFRCNFSPFSQVICLSGVLTNCLTFQVFLEDAFHIGTPIN